MSDLQDAEKGSINEKPGKVAFVCVDAVDTDSEGTEPEKLVKQFSFWSSLGMALLIVNSWIVATTTLNVGISQGGPVVVLWGELIAGVGQLAIALSLAELCSIWPSMSGQCAWTYAAAQLSRDDTKREESYWARLLSYIDAWLTWLGWCLMFSSAASVTTNVTFNIASLWHPDYVLKDWHFYLVYVLCLTVSLLVNILGSRHLHAFDATGLLLLTGGGILLVVVTLAVAGTKHSSPKFQSAEFVFTTFNNTSDWGNFVFFMTGMIQPTFTITCFDAVAHVIGEMPSPRRDAPRCIASSVVFGVITTFLVVMCLLFVITDLNEVTTSTAGPLVSILYQATESKVGATCLTLIPLTGIVLGAQATLTTASRVTLSIAEDEAVMFSAFLSRVSRRMNAPLPALFFPYVFSVLIGLLYLLSPILFSSILSTTLVSLGISYIIPIIIAACKGRALILEQRPQFSLGLIPGWVCYAIAIAWGLFTTVMFCFPATKAVDGTTLNYTAPVIGIAMVVAAVNWVVYSRKAYVAPHV